MRHAFGVGVCDPALLEQLEKSIGFRSSYLHRAKENGYHYPGTKNLEIRDVVTALLQEALCATFIVPFNGQIERATAPSIDCEKVSVLYGELMRFYRLVLLQQSVVHHLPSYRCSRK